MIQGWLCEACGRTGRVVLRKDDSPKKQLWRMCVSHRAQVGRDWHRPRFRLLTSEEVKAVLP